MLEIQTVNKGAELVSAKLNGIEKIHDGRIFGIDIAQYYFQ